MHRTKKNIKGKTYEYIGTSIRLPNGTVKRLEKRDKNQTKDQLKKYFQEKEHQAYTKHMLQHYKTDHIFTEEEFAKVENIRLNYKKIMKKLTPATKKDLLDRFTANFTYESNALEGNSLTLKDVAIVMFENMALKNKDLREIYETRNSRTVTELLMQNKFSITHESIIKLHKLLMKDLQVQIGYKTLPNVIVGRDIETIYPERVKEEMEKIMRSFNENKTQHHPIKLAALLHGQFEHIHPFEDGNGRVGRFLINLMLLKHKYPPIIIRKSQRIAYLKALHDFDHGHTDTLVRFILERFKETYKRFFEVYVKYI